MNYYVTISCLLALTASIKADGLWGAPVYAPGHASVDYYAYPRYAFDYAVNDPHTGDNKAQWEKRDGDVVKGAYSLVEPDGSIRVVEYWADDKSGFNAVVKRLGPSLHPTTVPAAPIYKAPIPVLSQAPFDPIAPISIGSVAKLGRLASAPLMSGPIYGEELSPASLYKSPPVSVPTPILPPSIYKAPLPIAHAPIIKSGPILSRPLPSYPAWSATLPLPKAPLSYSNIVPIAPWGDSFYKTSFAAPAYYSYDDLGHGLLSRGPLLPSWGPLNYNPGLVQKHR